MSSRPPQPRQTGSGAAPSIHGDQTTQAFGFAPLIRSHGHFGDSLRAISATDAAHDYRLRNARSVVLNSDLAPSNFRSIPYESSASSSSSLGATSTPPGDCTKPFTPAPPTVRIPSGDSTPQRVDSAFQDEFDHHPASPSSANSLRIHTDLYSAAAPRVDSLYGATTTKSSDESNHLTLTLSHESSASSLKPPSRTPSVRSAARALGFGSASSSRVPSPVIAAMSEVTPLPSPLLSGDSPGPWRRLHGPSSPRQLSQPLPRLMADSVLVTSDGEWVAAALANQPKRKAYTGARNMVGEDSGSNSEKDASASNNSKIHTRNRSTSEYHPDHLNIPKRMLTVSGPHATKPSNAPMRREPHLSQARGLTPIEKPPSPPPSECSLTATDASGTATKDKPRYEYFDALGRTDGKLRRWRAVRTLGTGTFSRVMLATSQLNASEEESESESKAGTGSLPFEPPLNLDRKSLVAVKICEHGPKGGASEDRVEMSLKRELEIMQSIHHPSLVDLKAFSIEPTRAILVLSYCPGGDLFDVATRHRELLSASLLRRIFAEVVGAVRYLHERHIVHRDIKLENVLVNLTPNELADRSIDWQTYPYSVTILTDLGLSRRVADDEKLTTRCGSEDYAAPEVIMGLQYDGRATDAWSLGVLLYALLESRLPFDPPPGMSDALRMRSRTSHRIARAEWQWIKYAGDDTDHDGDEKKFEAAGLLGAMEVTEGLLQRARSRWSLEKVAEKEWVSGGIAVEGGMRFREEMEGEII